MKRPLTLLTSLLLAPLAALRAAETWWRKYTPVATVGLRAESIESIQPGVARGVGTLGWYGFWFLDAQEQAGYFTHYHHRMQYMELRADGWVIGSGMVESGGRRFKDRFAQAGMRWSRGGAERLLLIRSAYMSGLFDARWRAACEDDVQGVNGGRNHFLFRAADATLAPRWRAVF